MKLIWTKSHLPLSKLIRWGLDEPVSHFAVVIEDSIVFHSNLWGVHIEWYSTFKEHCEVVYEIEVDGTFEDVKPIIDKLAGKPYDIKALLFFAYRGALLKFFKIPLPNRNYWADPDALLCTGLAQAFVPSDKDYEIVSPYQLYLMIKQSKEN
jgi:hypothetical protein